jgi:hypothetical protein
MRGCSGSTSRQAGSEGREVQGVAQGAEPWAEDGLGGRMQDGLCVECRVLRTYGSPKSARRPQPSPAATPAANREAHTLQTATKMAFAGAGGKMDDAAIMEQVACHGRRSDSGDRGRPHACRVPSRRSRRKCRSKWCRSSTRCACGAAERGIGEGEDGSRSSAGVASSLLKNSGTLRPTRRSATSASRRASAAQAAASAPMTRSASTGVWTDTRT